MLSIRFCHVRPHFFAALTSHVHREYFLCLATNINHMDRMYWKSLVKSTINQVAFFKLMETCSTSRKTSHLTYPRLKTSKYLHESDPQHARVIFYAKVRILDLKINFKKKYAQNLLCLFRRHDQETFEHVCSCSVGLWCVLRMSS